MTLFPNTEPLLFNLKDAEIVYVPNFFSEEESQLLFHSILNKTNWQQDDITLFGKTYQQPRLTALYANNNKSYSYSNITMQPKVFYKELLNIKNRVENFAKHNFTTCLLNLYRDGNDSNGWHADDEKELGKNPIIASISFGATRKFHLKHKTDKTLKQSIDLENGSLLLMKGTTQHFWKHQIPKTKKKVEKRINLTFRYIK